MPQTPAKPLLILDFDQVLFDTPAYATALGECLKPFGVTRETWLRAVKNTVRPPTLRTLAEKVAEYGDADPGELVRAMEKESEDAVWFLYADTRDFLDEMREITELHLLTFGDPGFQKMKLDRAGLGRSFKGMTFTEQPKEETKLPIPTVGQAIFLNDDIDELLAVGGRYRWSQHIHINRAGKDIPTGFPFKSFSDLRHAAPAIRELVKS